VWEYLPGEREESVHLAGFSDLDDVPSDGPEDTSWSRLLGLREVVYGYLEELRQNGTIGKSEEAAVALSGDLETVRSDLELTGADLSQLFIVSKVDLDDSDSEGRGVDAYPGLKVVAEPYEAHVCARCWRRVDEPVADPELPDLCVRCHEVVGRLLADGRIEKPVPKGED
jgi:isoleucyl-tRNA synthetase